MARAGLSVEGASVVERQGRAVACHQKVAVGRGVEGCAGGVGKAGAARGLDVAVHGGGAVVDERAVDEIDALAAVGADVDGALGDGLSGAGDLPPSLQVRAPVTVSVPVPVKVPPVRFRAPRVRLLVRS